MIFHTITRNGADGRFAWALTYSGCRLIGWDREGLELLHAHLVEDDTHAVFDPRERHTRGELEYGTTDTAGLRELVRDMLAADGDMDRMGSIVKGNRVVDLDLLTERPSALLAVVE